MFIEHVNLNVTNIDRAIDFYVNKLGFDLLKDESIGEGDRWVEIGSRNGSHAMLALSLVAMKPVMPVMMGTIKVENIRKLYPELLKKGVQFDGEPVTEFWGTGVVLIDPFNNLWYIGDSHGATEAD